MNSFISKPFSIASWVHEGMRYLHVIVLALVASRPAISDQPRTTQVELLPPPAPLLPPVPPEEDTKPPQGSTSAIVPPSPMPPHVQPSDRVTDEIEELMDRLKSQRSDLQQMGDRESVMADLHAEVTQNSIDYSLHLQRIHDRMSRLRSLLQHRENCKDTERRDSNDSSDKATPPDLAPAVHPSSPPPGSAGAPRDDLRTMASAFIVTENAVDRLSLANNLFAAGQIDLAQQIYAKLLGLEPAPTDRVWIEYQLANCYRRSGDMKQAEKLYRVVAGSTASLYWSERARWWMSNLARVQGFLDRQARFADSLDQLQEEFDEAISP